VTGAFKITITANASPWEAPRIRSQWVCLIDSLESTYSESMDPLFDWAVDALAPRRLSVSKWKSSAEDKIVLCSVVAGLNPDAVQLSED
jgi:hypothetical protein